MLVKNKKKKMPSVSFFPIIKQGNPAEELKIFGKESRIYVQRI